MGDFKLGNRLHTATFAMRGKFTSDNAREYAPIIISIIGMTPDGLSPWTWFYPLPSGKGGNGITYVQPFVESYLAWDAYDEKENGIIYLSINSCKPLFEKMELLLEFLREKFGKVTYKLDQIDPPEV